MTTTFRYVLPGSTTISERFVDATEPPFRLMVKTCTLGSQVEKKAVGAYGSIKGINFPTEFEDNRNGKIWKCKITGNNLLPNNVLSLSRLFQLNKDIYNPIK